MTLRRNPKKDPVKPEVRSAVLRRDRYACVAPELARRAGVELVGECATVFGAPMDTGRGYLVQELQIDHVKDSPGGVRRSLERWLQAACPRHHTGNNFLERKDIREAARIRLEEIYGEEPNADTDY